MKNLYIFILSLTLFANCNSPSGSDLKYSGSVFINVNVNDSVSGQFLLDTGSPVSLFDSSFVSDNKLKFTIIDSVKVGGSGNSEPVLKPLYKGEKLTICKDTFTPDLVLLLDLKKIIPVEDGIIGFQYFKDKIVQIDYAQHNLKLYSSVNQLDNGFKSIPIEILGDKIYTNLTLTINDGTTLSGRFLIDTGSEYALILDNYYADSLNLYQNTEKKIRKQVKNGGVGGTTYKFLIKASKAELADFQIEDILLSCSQQKHGATTGHKSQRIGTLGNRFLDKFTLVFALPERKIFLKPNSSYYEPYTYVRSGISLGKRQEKGYVIKSILEQSAAYNAGIREGDILLSINGKDVLELGYFSTKKMLNTKGRHRLVIQRNSDILTKTTEVEDMMKLL